MFYSIDQALPLSVELHSELECTLIQYELLQRQSKLADFDP